MTGGAGSGAPRSQRSLLLRFAARRDVTGGLVVVGLSWIVYLFCARGYDAGRGDIFYLAKAFTEGKTWLDFGLGPWDVIPIEGRFYVPFAPFPSILFAPLAFVFGALSLDRWEPVIDSTIAAIDVGLCWMLLGRLGVSRLTDRFWLCLLFGFSTVVLNVTTRGGVWHTGELIATLLTFVCLIDLWGDRPKPWLIGLLAGAAFLTRPPVAFALPFYALLLERPGQPESSAVAGGFAARIATRLPVREWLVMGATFGVSVAFFFWYNVLRFGSPFESGYALATLPQFLEQQRDIGLFSLAHVPMNINYFLLKLPAFGPPFPYLHPDGLGMSVLFTSPGLLLAFFAPWRSSRTWWLAGATVAVLVPTLLYYGGGWLQYGYRYFLDSIPFVMALCGLAVAKAGRLSWIWIGLILFGVVVNAIGVYWTYNG
jgi:hypothetical protein